MPGAFSLLEDAVHLLRRAGFSSLLRHWTGSVPFAVFLLICWNALSIGPVSDAQCAAASFLLALLLVLMNCRRAAFAGRLVRQLNGAPETLWTPARRWRFTALQAFLAASKPLVLLVSLLVIFPFARAVAFYRSAAAMSDRPGMTPRQLIAQGRRVASLDYGETWKLLPLLLLLFVATFSNIALTVAALPQLIRILTGYESSFSRSGAYFVQNPFFFAFALVLAWLIFDPYLQAVYCVRCFQGESRETGDDIRAGLRRLRSPLASAALALLAICSAHAADAIAPADLEQSVHRAMQSPDYAWRIPAVVRKSGATPWIVTITDRLINALKDGLKTIGRLISRILDWIFDRLGVQPNSQGGAFPSRGLHWSLYVLMALILLVLAWVIYRRRLFQRRRATPAAVEPVPLIRLEDESLSADRLPEQSWLDLGEQCLRENQFRLALRAFFLANLAALRRLEFLSIHPGKTNREFELELRRRARPFPEALHLFAANIASFEQAWYGEHAVTPAQIEELRSRAAAIKSALSPPTQEAAA